MKYEDILKQEDLKNFLGYWEKSKSYMKDNVIAYNGSLYKSLTDYNINNTPSTSLEHWDSLIQSAVITDAEIDALFD